MTAHGRIRRRLVDMKPHWERIACDIERHAGKHVHSVDFFSYLVRITYEDKTTHEVDLPGAVAMPCYNRLGLSRCKVQFTYFKDNEVPFVTTSINAARYFSRESPEAQELGRWLRGTGGLQGMMVWQPPRHFVSSQTPSSQLTA